MDLSDLNGLLGVARAGSLSGAARRLGLSTSTVARRLDALEAALGLRLVHRGAGGARLTAHGERVAALAAPLAAQAARVALLAETLRVGERSRPVRVSATEFVITDVLAPALPLLWRRHPEVVVQLTTQTELASLDAGQVELAVRLARPAGASLLARRLADLPLGLYASPDYLAGRDPARLDLSRERLLTYDDSYGRIPELDWFAQAGLLPAVRLRTSSTRALLMAARAGGGIALLPDLFARAAGLLAVAAPRPLPARSPWIVAHRGTRRLPAVRAVHDWIVAAFAQLQPGVQNAASSSSRSVAPPASTAADSPAVCGSMRAKKKRAVASLAR